MSNIADEVRKAGHPNAEPAQVLEAGLAALKKLGAHQEKMKKPLNATVGGLASHLVGSGAANIGPGLAALEKLCLQGQLP